MRKLLITLAFLPGIVAFAQEAPKKDSVKTENIKEVLMTKKVFQKKSDRLIYDVANSPIAKGTNSFDLLKETPMVSSTDDKTLKILGKNSATIFINGKKSNMDAEAIIAMLKSTPSEDISKIEVITVPSSEFQVESNDGIINIIMKKKMTDGVNGTLKMANNQGYFNNPSSGISANFRKGKLAGSGNLNFGSWTQRQYYQLANGDNTFAQTTEGTITDPNLNLGGYINLDYEISAKQNLGFSYNNRFNWSLNSVSDLYNEGRDLTKNTINRTTTHNVEDSRTKNHSFNLNYEWKADDLGSKLVLNSAYLTYQRNQENVNVTTDFDSQNITRKFQQKIPQIINNYGFMADYIQKFKNETTLSFGGNFNKTKTDNDVTLESIIPPTGIDAEQSNHFVYHENIIGFYATLEKSFSEKLSGKIGSRLEMTKSNGEVLGKAQDFDRNYNSFLPYLSVNYSINKNNNLSYAFSSRVRRPSFWQLNPSRMYLTENNYVQNNPFMKASTYYNQELNYMLKNSYFVVLNHSYITDVSEQIPLQRKVDGVTELRYIRTNYGDKQEFGLTIGMQKMFFKGIWNANYTATVNHNIFKGIVDTDPITGDVFPAFVLDKKSTFGLLQFNNDIRLSSKKDWYFGLKYFYLSSQEIEFGKLGSLQSLDLSMKKIWNDWTFLVEASDILGQNKADIDSRQANGYYNIVKQNQYNTQVTFTATYNFGNQKLKKVRNSQNANDEIRKRTGG